MEDLRYPIGRFSPDKNFTNKKRQVWIRQIADTPSNLRKAIERLDEEQLDTPYRPEGWTVRQVVHHLPDSHLNAYVRLKLALTEDNPTIRVYDEKKWAELGEARLAPVDVSLNLLEALHRRWDLMLRSLKPDDFLRDFQHPEMGAINIDTTVNLYAWHGRHHVAHITVLRERMGW